MRGLASVCLSKVRIGAHRMEAGQGIEARLPRGRIHPAPDASRKAPHVAGRPSARTAISTAAAAASTLRDSPGGPILRKRYEIKLIEGNLTSMRCRRGRDRLGTANPRPPPPRSACALSAARGLARVGFGGGEHMVHQAGLNPTAGIIGASPISTASPCCMGKIRRAECGNLRVHPDDARRPVRRACPRASIAKAFLLYPDPWPKKRHHRRTLCHARDIPNRSPGAENRRRVRVATDIPDIRPADAGRRCRARA